MASWTYLDRASTFAVLSPATPTTILDACVTAAYAEALLMSADPAEARAWRRATTAWLTWELTGQFGCDEAVTRQQAEPFRSWVGGAAGDGAGGALWLAYLSARHDAARGHFVRDVWGLASQRTWEGNGLRAMMHVHVLSDQIFEMHNQTYPLIITSMEHTNLISTLQLLELHD